jgi:hypothetical protein
VKRQNTDESPIDFIRREYSQWLGGTLTRAHIRRLDMTLYEALNRWLRSHELPADFNLPTRAETMEKQLSQAEDLSFTFTPEQREKLRLYNAARRRARKKS